jgi:hypothetical protein
VNLTLVHRLVALLYGVSLFEGGRRERLVAVFLSLHLLFHELTYNITVMAPGFPEPLQYRLLALEEAAMLAALLFLTWRRMTTWMLALTAAQALSLALWIVCGRSDLGDEPPFRFLHAALDILRGLIVIAATARHALAAPRRPPEGDLDIDLVETAQTAWPGLLRQGGRDLGAA